jgi:hypothetical protein
MSGSSRVLDNLRGFVILLVLAFHSVLAYLGSLPASPFPFDSPPYLWRSFPIVDSERWFGFDLFCAWLDVFLMSMMFLLSGLFVWQSLARRGSRIFVLHRLVRLGLPFALVVILLMPLTHYATYRQTALDPGLLAYWDQLLALPLWPAGPVWFLWLLLVADIAAAALHELAPHWGETLARFSSLADSRPSAYFAGLLAASALAYIPLALVFTPWPWVQFGPFGFQLSRPLHYAVYFFAGAGIGACGIDRGLLRSDGLLVRRWALWLVAAAALFALWLYLTALTMAGGGSTSLGLQTLDDLSFVLACGSSCLFVVALFLRFAKRRLRLFDVLKDNAYGMYLIHYVFVVWLQYALLGAAIPAIAKAPIVFGGTLLLSWASTAVLRRIPPAARVIGADRSAMVKAS